MSKADALGGSATFEAVAQPLSSRAASFARFAGQDAPPAPGDMGTEAPTASPRLPINAIARNPYNPREELKAIEEMADSLTGRGIIQPLTVVTRSAFLAAHPGQDEALGTAQYVVVDGNRRLAGAKVAGIDDVPVHIDDSLADDADTLLETALTAAVQHEDLDPLDEAKALQRLVEVHGSQRAVARSLGKSSGWVTQRLALLKLTPDLQQAVEAKKLPVEVARTVGQLPEQQQGDAAEAALAKRELKKATRKQGAYAVSTPDESAANPAHTAVPTSAPTPSSAHPSSTPAQHSVDADQMPWDDGAAVMDTAFARLNSTQRSAFILRYFQISRGVDDVVADMKGDLTADNRTALAVILEQVATQLRQEGGTPPV
ncbi:MULTISPECIES: ParB/RepB/Spo0J family partition protein [Streptomyces]|uniref:ParB/RepB/Spo0J family partition protein n=1 Tax=Streptomyces flavovirens TaxID=52258 RepID=A0ABV8N9F9_9ACTN|nr:ParB/RepB/Spo0J family partition protein [Streptomyces sp. MBT51]MBK3596060.1 ParB/RepB/Spo0J family partition protein [Streptomyces sp. MBT51]